MRCDEVLARLDAEGPSGLDPAHLTHARACTACGMALQAAVAAEALFREAPPAPTAAFTAAVMERVEATERARRRMAEWPRPSLWSRWWRALAEQPAVLAALALAPAPLILALVWPESATSLVAFLRGAAAGWIASAGSALAAHGTTDAQPARALMDAVMVTAVVVAFVFAFQWAGEALGGLATSARRAPRAERDERDVT